MTEEPPIRFGVDVAKTRDAIVVIPGTVETHTRTISGEVDGKRVELDVPAAKRRDGSTAIYPDGTGPFASNRAARRAARRRG